MFDVNHIIAAGGILAVSLIIFAESGLLIGFFLPGDTLLFAAGIFASEGKLSLGVLIPVCILAAVLGYQVGYLIGAKAGRRLFTRKDSLFFDADYLVRSEKFFERHGAKAIVLARFVAIVRTFVSVVAGAGKMDQQKYLLYNVIGAIIWVTTIIMLGVWLGSRVPNIDKYILPIVGLAVLASIAGPVFHLLRQPKFRKRLLEKIRSKKA